MLYIIGNYDWYPIYTIENKRIVFRHHRHGQHQLYIYAYESISMYISLNIILFHYTSKYQ